MNVLRKEEIHTIEDIYDLPDGKRAELIDGQIYYLAASIRTHQRLFNFINTEINLYIRNNNGNCEIYPAPFAVYLNEDDYNYVEPDHSYNFEHDNIDEYSLNDVVPVGIYEEFSIRIS